MPEGGWRKGQIRLGFKRQKPNGFFFDFSVGWIKRSESTFVRDTLNVLKYVIGGFVLRPPE